MPNYRSLLPGGFFSSDPFDRTIPVSIRCNNPGAINGAPWERRYPGYVDTVETTPGNRTTIFETPEHGVAVWWELLRRYREAGATTITQIITRYGGGQNYSGYVNFVVAKTGFAANKNIDLGDDGALLAFGRAMFHYEAGRRSPLHDDQILYGLAFARSRGAGAAPPAPVVDWLLQTPAGAPTPTIPDPPANTGELTLSTREGVMAIQSALIKCGYLDPPADGAFGPVSKWALGQFAVDNNLQFDTNLSADLKRALLRATPLPLTPDNSLAGRIVRAMEKNGYWIARHPACTNIVYIEGMDPNGTPNDNRNNVFNDTRLVFRLDGNGVPSIVGAWEATTEPSRKWTMEPMNPGGAFHIKFGQYKSWIKGWYHTHDALIQVGEIEGFRDPHKTLKRDYRYPVKGSEFGVHHHWGYDLPHDDMGNSSAGCLVGRATSGHRQFMSIVMQDPRYAANPGYRFMAAIMPVGDL